MPASARRVARLLQASGHKVVFAESCTGGLVSGALTRVPGISSYHCGGMVVYRNETKRAYLGIPAALLKDPGPVSAKVAELMALGVLEKTPEADVAVSVTGHLGPNAPPLLDGLVFVSLATRTQGRRTKPRVQTHQLRCGKRDSRAIRQRLVALQVLDLLAKHLEATPGQHWLP